MSSRGCFLELPRWTWGASLAIAPPLENPNLVIAGLDPAIHADAGRSRRLRRLLDCRVKLGNDK